MTDSTFILRFTHSDSSEIEEQEHATPGDAWAAFRLFAEPDSMDIYSRVELVEYNWAEGQAYPLAQMTFLA